MNSLEQLYRWYQCFIADISYLCTSNIRTTIGLNVAYTLKLHNAYSVKLHGIIRSDLLGLGLCDNLDKSIIEIIRSLS